MSNEVITDFIGTRRASAVREDDGYRIAGRLVGHAEFEAVYELIEAMGFAHALILAQQGHQLRRALWREGVIAVRDQVLVLLPPDGSVMRWRPDQSDLFARDWRIAP